MGKIDSAASRRMGAVPPGGADEDFGRPGGARKETSAESAPPESRTRIEVRSQLIREVKATAETLKELGMPALASQVVSLLKRASHDRFAVAFVGEFSHGKSTLINRLLGRDVLPVDDLPTTAMLTRITCGRPETITLLDPHGKKIRALPLASSSWKGLTACDEEGNATGEKPRDFIRVTLDDAFLRATGTDILDTPGANDGSAQRDREISRALLATEGAVLCLDAQKGVMETQTAFIRDRLLAPRIPFMALAITHLDLVEEEKRDRQVTFIMAALKRLRIDMPVVITNDVAMPSDRYASLVGLEKLRTLIARWSVNPERARRVESWLTANVCNLLAMGLEALGQQRRILEAKDEDRNRLIVEKQAEVTALHDEWEKLRAETDFRCGECQKDFERRLQQEEARIIQSMQYRISTVPDPAKWYSQSYAYEMANRVSGAIIALDNAVTETARNDFDWLNKEIMRRYKASIDRDGKSWNRTEAAACYVHNAPPRMTDIGRMERKNVKINAAATAVGGVVGALLFGVGGLIGSVGASTATRFLTKRKVDEEIARARESLSAFVIEDVGKIMREATCDSAARIRLIYSDINRAARQSESTWMQTQHTLIAEAARNVSDPQGETLEAIGKKSSTLESLSENLKKHIL